MCLTNAGHTWALRPTVLLSERKWYHWEDEVLGAQMAQGYIAISGLPFLQASALQGGAASLRRGGTAQPSCSDPSKPPVVDQ